MQTWMYPHALSLAPMSIITTPITLALNISQVLANQYYWGRKLQNNTSLYASASLAAGVGRQTWDKFLKERDLNAIRTDPADHIHHNSFYWNVVDFPGYSRLSDISKRSGPMRIIWDWTCHGG